MLRTDEDTAGDINAADGIIIILIQLNFVIRFATLGNPKCNRRHILRHLSGVKKVVPYFCC